MRAQVGQRIRELRKARGLTQDAVAERAGLNPKYYAGIERQGANITLDSFERIAAALEVPIADFFRFSEDSGKDDRRVVVDLAKTVAKNGTDDKVARLRLFMERILT